MPAVPDGAKTPTDRKPKDVNPDPVFSFEHNGETHRFEKPTEDVMTPGFVRRHRNDQAEMILGLYEALAGETVLEVLDNLDFKTSGRVQTEFGKHCGEIIGADSGD